jgi:hypothetical protein
MASNRRNIALLVGLVVVLAGVLAWQFWWGSPKSQTTARPTRSAAGGGPLATFGAPPEVKLHALEAGGPEPSKGARDPFRLGGRGDVGSTSPAPGVPTPTADAPEARNSGPPPLPPIPYKFIGTLSGSQTAGKIAVLSDGKFVYYGREGDIIEGRYRLVKIAEESLQIEYLDGRGRQTLRMSGT